MLEGQLQTLTALLQSIALFGFHLLFHLLPRLHVCSDYKATPPWDFFVTPPEWEEKLKHSSFEP